MSRATPEPDPKPKGSIVDDLELVTMQKIQRLISKLPDSKSRIRVISWLKDKLDFHLVDMPKG